MYEKLFFILSFILIPILPLGIFIGKTLLEKNFASVNCRNSKTRSGAEVVIKWNNSDLMKI